jgi:hypothetical protein
MNNSRYKIGSSQYFSIYSKTKHFVSEEVHNKVFHEVYSSKCTLIGTEASDSFFEEMCCQCKQ